MFGYSIPRFIYRNEDLLAGPSSLTLGSMDNKKPTVIPAQDSLIADLLSLDLGGGGAGQPSSTSLYAPAPVSSGLDDLLGLGSDSLVHIHKWHTVAGCRIYW